MLGEINKNKKAYDNLFGWGKDDEPTDAELYDMSLEELMELDVEPTNTTNTSTNTTTQQSGSSFDWGQVGNLLGNFAQSSNVFGTNQTQQQPNIMYAPAPQQKSNAGLYIGLAIGVILIVVVIMMVMKGKK